MTSAERLFDRSQIEAALDRMAAQIISVLKGSNPLALCVMNGGLVTAAHLLMRLNFPLQLDYIHVTRYLGQTRGGEIQWHKKPAFPLKGRVVLLIDDILDEGHTLAAILDYCRTQGSARTYAAVLVDKHHDRKQPGARVDFVELTVEDRYVFGFGMDYKDYLRNLPAIYAVKES